MFQQVQKGGSAIEASAGVSCLIQLEGSGERKKARFTSFRQVLCQVFLMKNILFNKDHMPK